ncbi:MAG: Qat anti-phage system TatD family nuclease QatD [Thermodesulfobacteriota bacterium]
MVCYVDSHCHLDLYPDMMAAINQAEGARIYTLAVTTTPKAWPRNRDLTQHCKYVRAALGLHPQLVAERHGELSLWEKYLPEARYIGEVGLDAGPHFYRSFDLQQQVFVRILKMCAEVGGKILTVHSTRAVKSVLDSIEEHLPRDRGRVILHWFTGNMDEAKRALSLGCYFSISSKMMKSNPARALVAKLPLGRLLTETDGPFTTIDGRPTHPEDAKLAVDAIAIARRADPTAIAEAVLANLTILTNWPD